jgi:hypothetical protein
LNYGNEAEVALKWVWWDWQALRQDADQIDGLWFASLAKVREFKVWRGSAKDLTDVRLIDIYLESHSTDAPV